MCERSYAEDVVECTDYYYSTLTKQKQAYLIYLMMLDDENADDYMKQVFEDFRENMDDPIEIMDFNLEE